MDINPDNIKEVKEIDDVFICKYRNQPDLFVDEFMKHQVMTRLLMGRMRSHNVISNVVDSNPTQLSFSHWNWDYATIIDDSEEIVFMKFNKFLIEIVTFMAPKWMGNICVVKEQDFRDYFSNKKWFKNLKPTCYKYSYEQKYKMLRDKTTKIRSQEVNLKSKVVDRIFFAKNIKSQDISNISFLLYKKDDRGNTIISKIFNIIDFFEGRCQYPSNIYKIIKKIDISDEDNLLFLAKVFDYICTPLTKKYVDSLKQKKSKKDDKRKNAVKKYKESREYVETRNYK